MTDVDSLKPCISAISEAADLLRDLKEAARGDADTTATSAAEDLRDTVSGAKYAQW